MLRPPILALILAVLVAGISACAQMPDTQAPDTPTQGTQVADAKEPDAQGPDAEEPEPTPSAMDSRLFYELLLAEISARGGDPADSLALMLDAARKNGDSALYQ